MILREKLNSIYYLMAFSFLIFYCITQKELFAFGVTSGIEYCLQNLIPSLFPMIFLSCAISSSPADIAVCFIFSGFCRYFLKLPKICGSTVIFGLCLGYPVGCKLASNLLKQGKITEKDASRLSLFCLNPGLPFTVILVGGMIFNSLKLGFFMFISTVFASLLIGFLLSIGKPIPENTASIYPQAKLPEIISTSASQSLSSTLTMCLYVTIFASFSPLIIQLNLVNIFQNCSFVSPVEISSIFWFILEITQGVTNATSLNASCYIFMFGLAFGGLCIHLQVFSFFPKSVIDYKMFYFCRLLNAIISLLLLKFILYLNPITQSASSTISEFTVTPSTGTATASICLILLSCTYIYMNKNMEIPEKM